MSEKDTKKELTNDAQPETLPEEKTDVENLIETFKIPVISSAEMIKSSKFAAEDLLIDENDEDIFLLEPQFPTPNKIDLSEGEIELLIEKSFVFKELAEPKLPELPTENRARLQMQSPTRLYFYWSIKNNPFQTLKRVFGGNAGNYSLVVKLSNQTRNREEIVPIEAEGSTWFDVDADSTYRAEIGFYAANRPFARLMFSNTIETPRKNPSPRQDFSSDWTISANQFAKVLDDSGYAQDAAEIILAGDDLEFARKATQDAFSQIAGTQQSDFVENYADEIRFALLALASGYALENLRGQISKNLFAKMQESGENLSAERAFNALRENFGEFAGETIEEEEFGQTVFGASSINFPKFPKRRTLPKFAPISSLNFMS